MRQVAVVLLVIFNLGLVGLNLDKHEVIQVPSFGSSTDEPSKAPPVPIEIFKLEVSSDSVTVSGKLPDQKTADSLKVAAVSIYGNLVDATGIVVEADAPQVAWWENTPGAIEIFARVNSGALTIRTDKTILTGEAATGMPAVIKQQLGTLNFPTIEGELTETFLEPSLIQLVSKSGQVELSGEVPDLELKEKLNTAAVEVFGEANVTDELVVASDTFTWFNTQRFPSALATFTAFENFRIGLNDGQIYAVIDDSIEFEGAGVTVPTEESSQALIDGLVPLLAEQQHLKINVVGHTDSTGGLQANLAVSKQRADAARDVLIEAGIKENRIVATGVGPEKPRATNDTAAGQALNRRVEIQVGVVPPLLETEENI